MSNCKDPYHDSSSISSAIYETCPSCNSSSIVYKPELDKVTFVSHIKHKYKLQIHPCFCVCTFDTQPNIFHRTMQKLFFGFEWMENK